MTLLNIAQAGGMTRYLDEAKRFPMLSPEQERDLATAWRERGDEEALRLLTGSHLRLVIKIARGFAGYGLPASELIAEGNVGLMQAAQKFDSERGFRFATYAIWWIRAAIQEYILHNWSMVKIGTTAAQKKLFFNLRRLKGRMEELEQGDLSPAAVTTIATELDVAETEVVEMNRRLSMGDSSLNASIGSEGDTDWMDMLSDDRPTQEFIVAEADELALRRRLLGQALEKLNDRERQILLERRLAEEPATLEVLGERYAVSRERIRQIEARAFEKLQKAVLNAAQTLRKPAGHAMLAV
ncbi:RNA polymerase sigma 70 [Skermanella stibiiresistens SB22]|uniref:RNA polymerase sigma factor RpoH n=1 Tax=Skermanella stibiiresistens SB22 TaxID=1385369 RepID=W9GVV0_9PROT|nr:RNA polymerase sigma factor RpoH [Skermanella stibiiresistens]EWY37934.1 RNA polymerase sigma 70 [Skermanella stibiiresistens SB22]